MHNVSQNHKIQQRRSERMERMNRLQASLVAWLLVIAAIPFVSLHTRSRIHNRSLLSQQAMSEPTEPTKQHEPQKRPEQASYFIDKPEYLKLPTPVIILSLPKSGTTSLYHFFHNNKIPTSHYCCRPGAGDHRPCSPPDLLGKRDFQSRKARKMHHCGSCIKGNLDKGVAPLKGCGDDYFQVYAQMDREMRIDNVYTQFLPQIVALDQIHEHYPNATFILGTRDPAKWERSVRNWFNMKHLLKELHLPEYDYPRGVVKLQDFYKNHTSRVREFARRHPSHRFIEIDIEDDSSGEILAKEFGLSNSAWGHANARITTS